MIQECKEPNCSNMSTCSTCLDHRPPAKQDLQVIVEESESEEDERTECEYTNCSNLTSNENELCPLHNYTCSECDGYGAELYQSRYYCETCILEVKRAPVPEHTKRKLVLIEELPTKRPKTEQQLYEEKAERLNIQLYPPNQQGDPQIRPANGKFKSFKRSLRELDEWEQEITNCVNSISVSNNLEDVKFILRHMMSRASFLTKRKKQQQQPLNNYNNC